jgi:signal peptidase II
MRRLLRSLTILFVLVACVGCDQAAKSVVEARLASQPPVSLLGGVLRLQYAENPGAFLSLGADLPAATRSALLVILVGVLLIGALFYLVRARNLNLGQWLGLALLAGGGLGNLVDRLLHSGRVVDFAILSLGPLHTGVFNFADLAIVGGLAAFALASMGADKHVPAQ